MAQQQQAGSEDNARMPANAAVPVATPRTSERSFRERLEQKGVVLGFSQTAEGFTNWKGGLDGSRGGAYLGSIASSVSLDLSGLGLARGQVFVSAQSLHGRGINDSKIGAVQSASNLDTQRFGGRLIEAWYGDSYLEGRLRLKAGRQYADAEFGVIENGADFLNSSYGLIPTTPMPTYPEPDLGVSLWVSPSAWISWGVGVFKGGSLDTPSGEGSPSRKRAFTILESKMDPFPSRSSQHGTYRLGVFSQSRGAWLSTQPDRALESPVRNYGLYATANHWFMRRSDNDDNRGPGVFFQWGWTPSDRNEVSGYHGGGFVYKGLLPRRPQDSVGVGITRARLAGAGGETVVELFYKCQLASKVMIQPDLQWYRSPGGAGPKALVAGVRMLLEF